MPELPEVEVTRQGVAPHLDGNCVHAVILRRDGLRWPFPPTLPQLLTGRTIRGTGRRGKYLLIHFDHGSLIIHLGMSGHLRILPPEIAPEKHDHFDLVIQSRSGLQAMRLTDPRRFGAVLWHDHADGGLEQHVLLKKLGVEPLSEHFSARLLHRESRKRSTNRGGIAFSSTACENNFFFPQSTDKLGGYATGIPHTFGRNPAGGMQAGRISEMVGEVR